MIQFQLPKTPCWRGLFLCMVLVGVFSFQGLKAQIKGSVTDALTNDPLPGAVLRIKDSATGTFADSSGHFELAVPNSLLQSNVILTVSFAGYGSQDFTWEPGQTLNCTLSTITSEGLEITEQRHTFEYANTAFRTEVVGRNFLQSLPANNSLMDAIDYVSGMRQQINCGVCGTNDIHINGMEGPYTLVLIDGMPIVSALGSVYGLNGIPQSMIERIEIVKGPATAMYGAEAMGGVVNIVTRNPRDMPLLSVGGYGTSHGEANADLAFKARLGNLSSLWSGNYYHMQHRIDHNGDGFTDIPLSQRLSLFNKWTLQRPKGRIAQVAFKYYNEDRFGGELDWQPIDKGSNTIYGEAIDTRRFEAIGTYQLPLAREDFRIDFSFAHHNQDSYYGKTHFKALQNSAYAAGIWLKEWKHHRLQAGATLRYNHYDDNTAATVQQPDESWVGGLFFQDEWQLKPRFSTLLGTRLDYHPAHGPILSPRINFRYRPTSFSNIRLTLGRGFRTVNLFTEEHAALTGSRTVLIEGELAPERSLNANLNFNQVLNLGNSAATLDVDAFFAQFENRILPNYDIDPDLIVYRNLEGSAQVFGIGAKWSQSFTFPLIVDLGGTFLKSQVLEANSAPAQQLLTPNFQGVFNVQYKIHALRTSIAWTGKVIGPMELPQYEAPFERPTRSGWFTEQNLQVSTDLGKGLSLQVGCRNILNYTQPSPLVDPQNPFGDSFDTAYAYGPLQSRRLVMGLNWSLDSRRATSKVRSR